MRKRCNFAFAILIACAMSDLTISPATATVTKSTLQEFAFGFGATATGYIHFDSEIGARPAVDDTTTGRRHYGKAYNAIDDNPGDGLTFRATANDLDFPFSFLTFQLPSLSGSTIFQDFPGPFENGDDGEPVIRHDTGGLYSGEMTNTFACVIAQPPNGCLPGIRSLVSGRIEHSVERVGAAHVPSVYLLFVTAVFGIGLWEWHRREITPPR